jgi:citrate lyase subunit beta / citryl-CoA lyase
MGVDSRLRRSCLAVPGSSAKMLANAAELDADQIFVDLEDAVAPDKKTDETRDQVVAALRDRPWRARTRVVRVNAVGTPWCLDDLLAVVGGAGDILDCVMVPKVESATEIHYLAHLLEQLERKHRLPRPIAIEVQIESPRGLLEVEHIAAASTRIETLVFGPGDYAAAAGLPQLTVGAIDPEYPGDQWHYVLSRIVTTARAFGLQAIDGPYAAIRDLDGFRESARRSRLLGFDGKWALHPDQVPICNATYVPTQEEFDRAEQILEVYEEAALREGAGAAVFESEMIDEASRKMATSIVQRGRAIGMVRASG